MTPNPTSKLLTAAIVGAAGLSIPPDAAPPKGMAALVLYVPMAEIAGKSPMDIQADLGLPWYMGMASLIGLMDQQKPKTQLKKVASE